MKNYKELHLKPPAGPEHYGMSSCLCLSGGYGYLCTLDAGHEGSHEAADSRVVLATWDD